jgi:hypothetical protein
VKADGRDGACAVVAFMKRLTPKVRKNLVTEFNNERDAAITKALFTFSGVPLCSMLSPMLGDSSNVGCVGFALATLYYVRTTGNISAVVRSCTVEFE